MKVHSMNAERLKILLQIDFDMEKLKSNQQILVSVFQMKIQEYTRKTQQISVKRHIQHFITIHQMV